MPFVTTISYIAREFVTSFLAGYLFLPVYVIIFFIIKKHYEKYKGFQADIAERIRKPIKELLKEAVFYGLVSGFAGSIGAVHAGVAMSSQVPLYLFVIMVGLSIINVRFMCISYAAGILILSKFLLGMPDLDSTQLLIIIGIVHAVESMLIFFNGAKDSIPVYIRHKENITGAFLMQKYWPLPIVFLSFIPEAGGGGLERLAVFDWWPAFKPEILGAGALALAMNSIIAVSGYSGIAITRQPERKAREMACQTFLYSLAMLAIGILSARIYAFKVIGAVFAIAAHEAMMLYNYHKEKRGEPLFVSVRRGIRVFDVLEGSHAEKMGIKRGDIILSINGRDVQTEDGMDHVLSNFPTFLWINVLGADGTTRVCELKCYPFGARELGILIVPREREVTYNIDHLENFAILRNLVARFKNG